MYFGGKLDKRQANKFALKKTYLNTDCSRKPHVT